MPTTAKLHRIRRALRRYGVKGSAQEAAALVRNAPARRRAQRADQAFDRQLGVETSGIVRLHELAFESENKEHGARYQATSPEAFGDIMDKLDLGERELTFIDIGSGKGRALLLASRLPFRRLVGVEFSPELTATAERNVASWRARTPGCPEIELLCQDATAYAFPDEPLLVYLYNPFEEPVMLEVLANLRASLEHSPRRVLLVLIKRVVSLEALARVGFVPSTAPGAPGELFLPAA